VLVSLLGSCCACARFGYDLPDWNSDAPGAGGRQSSHDAGDPSAGGASSGGLPDASANHAGGGASPDAGVAGSGDGASGAGGAANPAASCADGVRGVGESGVDCGGPSCAPCQCALGAPEPLGSPNFPGNDLWSPSLSSDGLSLYFAVTVPGVSEQIAVATRSDRGAEFGLGQPLPSPVNQGTDGTPYLAASGLSLYFFSERAGGAGGRDLYVAARTTTSAPFDTVRALSSLNTADREHLPWVSADELSIYFVSNRVGVADVFRATRSSTSDEFETPEAVTELNSEGEDGGLALSPDGLMLILASDRAGGTGARDLYLATRTSTSQPFSSPVPLTDLDTAQNEFDPAFSIDGDELYFASNRGGGDTLLYRSLRSCSR
jgi:hypothetical protein